MLLLSLVALIASAGPALAHEGAFVPSDHSAIGESLPHPSARPELGASAPSVIPGVLAACTALAALLVRRHRRVVVAGALTAIVVVLGFEDALHSVHHKFDPAETKGCLITVVTAHVAATTVDPVTLTDLIAPRVESYRAESEPTRLVSDPPRSDRGRAPPA
jgi:hypothetical protein